MSPTIPDGAAADLLRHLAERTVNGPEPYGTGKYHYIHTASSYLSIVREAGTGATGGSIEREERRQWIAPDGSGRLWVTKNGERVHPSADFPAGRLAANFISTTDPVVVTAELRKRTPADSTAALMRTFRQIWNNQVVPAALQRLLLLDLTARPDLSVVGDLAVGCVDEKRRTRHVLTFDPGTGALTRAEVTALDGADVPIATPAIITDTKWLCSGYSATVESPPR